MKMDWNLRPLRAAALVWLPGEELLPVALRGVSSSALFAASASAAAAPPLF